MQPFYQKKAFDLVRINTYLVHLGISKNA